MKQFFKLLVLVLTTTHAVAQTPEKMSYQAVIRDSAHQLVTNTEVGMQFSILQGAATGTAVYVETQTSTTNANGLVSVELGTGTLVNGSFTTIDWANGPYFIKTETDPTGGSNYTITGTSQLMSVPYALYAKSAGDSSIPDGSNPNDLLIWSGTEWSILAAGEEGSTLQIVDGEPTWTTVPSGGVQYGFQDSFDNLDINLNQLHSDRARIEIEKAYGSSLDPNMTSMSLLISTNSNPILINSESHEINLQDLNDDFRGASVLFNNLTRDTRYYYRAIINNEFIDENVYTLKTPYALGENFQGGILAYVYQPSEDKYIEGQMHGFVVAESALTGTAAWGCEGTNLAGMITGGSASSTSSQNQAIISNCNDEDFAAKICNNLTINGYSDWLLPSKDVINNGIRQSDVLNNLDIIDGYYWTCTPHSNNPAQSAWATHINNGSNIQANKSVEYHIIPVREF